MSVRPGWWSNLPRSPSRRADPRRLVLRFLGSGRGRQLLVRGPADFLVADSRTRRRPPGPGSRPGAPRPPVFDRPPVPMNGSAPTAKTANHATGGRYRALASDEEPDAQEAARDVHRVRHDRVRVLGHRPTEQSPDRHEDLPQQNHEAEREQRSQDGCDDRVPAAPLRAGPDHQIGEAAQQRADLARARTASSGSR